MPVELGVGVCTHAEYREQETMSPWVSSLPYNLWSSLALVI